MRVHASAEAVAQRRPAGAGVIEPMRRAHLLPAHRLRLAGMLALYLAWLGVDFDVDGPPELVAELRTLAARYARAAERGDRRAKADDATGGPGYGRGMDGPSGAAAAVSPAARQVSSSSPNGAPA